jgi:hypothetical protein
MVEEEEVDEGSWIRGRRRRRSCWLHAQPLPYCCWLLRESRDEGGTCQEDVLGGERCGSTGGDALVVAVVLERPGLARKRLGLSPLLHGVRLHISARPPLDPDSSREREEEMERG